MSGRRSRRELAFDAYFELGPERSLKRLHLLLVREPALVGGATAPGLRTLETWSVRERWSERVSEIEREARVSADRVRVERVRERSERLRQAGLLMQSKGLTWLNDQDPSRVRASEAVRAITEGVQLEALGLGNLSADPSVEADYTQFLGRLSDDQLDRLEQLLRDPASPGAARAVETEA